VALQEPAPRVAGENAAARPISWEGWPAGPGRLPLALAEAAPRAPVAAAAHAQSALDPAPKAWGSLRPDRVRVRWGRVRGCRSRAARPRVVAARALSRAPAGRKAAMVRGSAPPLEQGGRPMAARTARQRLRPKPSRPSWWPGSFRATSTASASPDPPICKMHDGCETLARPLGFTSSPREGRFVLAGSHFPVQPRAVSCYMIGKTQRNIRSRCERLAKRSMPIRMDGPQRLVWGALCLRFPETTSSVPSG
jgi:hypothetical protein